MDFSSSTSNEELDLFDIYIQRVQYELLDSARYMSYKTDVVAKFIETLVENMKEVLSCKARSIVPVEKEIKALTQELLFLRNFVVLTENWCSAEHEILKELLIHAESVAHSTACFFYLCSEDSNTMDEDMLNEVKLQLSCQLQRIKPIEPKIRGIYIEVVEALKSSQVIKSFVDKYFLGFVDSLLRNMIELSNLKKSPMISIIHHIEALHDELKILRYFLVDPPAELPTESYDLDRLLLHIKNVVCDVACFIYTCYDNDITEDMVVQLSPALSFLLQEFKVTEEKAGMIYDQMIPKSLRSQFPKTNELGVMDIMIQNLKELLNSKADSIVQLRYQIEAIHGNTVSLKEEFLGIAEQPSEHVGLKDLWARFRDIVYHTEYVIDSVISSDDHLWCQKLGLFYVIVQMKYIKKAIEDMKGRSENNIISGTSPQSNSNLQVANVAENMPINHVELFEDEARKITEQLTNGWPKLHIFSIVGMPGIGKTTLANSLYENPAIHKNFYVRARCCVTQTYEKRRLLLEILQQVGQESDPGDAMHVDDLAPRLYRSLKGQKYLILFDDIWDIFSWIDIRTSFPDDNKGSRIIFTSRFHDIASQIDSKNTTFPLHQLSDAKSWELLQVKLFKNESCPQELLEVGKQLAIECKGLPLAVDLVAGLLKTTDRREDSWLQFTTTLNTHLLEGQQGCKGVLELSYNNLSSHLKPCFLYFAAFPEDKEMSTRKLMQLWIAEGFIQLKNDDKGSCLEDVAEKYLNDLIARSLVTVSQRRSDGGVKASRVHDLLLEFALAKAKEEFFLQAAPLYSDLDAVMESTDHPYRLCAHTDQWDILPLLPNLYTRRTHSLLCSNSVSQILSLDASILPKNFKLVRVLHLPGVATKYFRNTSWMVHLRFLYLLYISIIIPSEVSNLQNLETFVLRIFPPPKVELPKTIWNLKRLRHFNVNRPYSLPGYSLDHNSLKFDDLQTLSTPLLSHGEDCEKILRGLPNLRRLSCIFTDSWNDSSNCNQLPVLNFLKRLESLKVAYDGKILHPCEFKFPSNLKKLTLSKFGLPWTEISTFGKLPNLQVLKLLTGSFVGKIWDMTEGEFLKLKFLKLESLDIAEWNATEDSLPSLEKLVLSNCNQLEEIPTCLGDVPTLQRLDLRFCSHSMWISARIIEEKQKEMGNEQFVITKVQKLSLQERIWNPFLARNSQAN